MSLHRTSGKPDWETVTSASRNIYQNIAAATIGIVTPANVISLIGFGVVIYGLIAILNNAFWLGLLLLGTGRLLDIVDGAVAEATKTKSPLGEAVDASIDKFGTLFTIIVLAVANVAPWWVIVALVAPQVIIPLVIFYKRHKGIQVHPTRPGKLSMATAWVGIVGLLVAKAMGDVPAITIGVYVLTCVSLILGLYALWQYTTGRD